MVPSDYAGEPKLNKVRSIQSSPPPEPVFVPKNPRLRNRSKEITRNDDAKAAALTRKNSEKTSEPKSQSTTTRSAAAFTRRRGAPSSATVTSSSTAVPVTQKQFENVSRFKPTRKSVKDTSPTISKSRRPFATRSTTESASIAPRLTTKAPLTTQRAPLARVNLRQSEKPRQKPEKAVRGDINDSSEEENYPEHFKLLLKNKANSNSALPTQIINESEKKASRKVTTVKYYRQSPVTTISTPTATETKSLRSTTSRVSRSTTSASSPSTTARSEKKFQFAQRPRVLARTRATSTTENPQSVADDDQAKATSNRLFKRPKPTDRARSNQGSTLQEPPTEKPAPIYHPPRSSRPASSEPTNTQTEFDLSKQIDPPIHEYFPRTSSVSRSLCSFALNRFPFSTLQQGSSSLKYSARFRNSDSIPARYQPTVPTVSTTSSVS